MRARPRARGALFGVTAAAPRVLTFCFSSSHGILNVALAFSLPAWAALGARSHSQPHLNEIFALGIVLEVPGREFLGVNRKCCEPVRCCCLKTFVAAVGADYHTRVRYDTVNCGMLRYDVRYSAVQYTVRYTVRYGTVRYFVRHGTVRHGAICCSAPQDYIQRDMVR